MPIKRQCSRCSGTGLIARSKEHDGPEADPEMHPFIAASKKPCEPCGGSGEVTVSRRDVAAAEVAPSGLVFGAYAPPYAVMRSWHLK